MILIVDDDKAIRQSLALVLKRKGYETALAGNPDEARRSACCANISSAW